MAIYAGNLGLSLLAISEVKDIQANFSVPGVKEIDQFYPRLYEFAEEKLMMMGPQGLEDPCQALRNVKD